VNLSERFPVSAGKLEALTARMRALGIDARLIEERFTKGGGPGGQKRNKTNNVVQLSYPPLDLCIRCGTERSRSLNRFLALRELVDEIEARVSPASSARLREIDRLRASKARAARRARAHHGTAPAD
jgi:protein subunit release factor B